MWILVVWYTVVAIQRDTCNVGKLLTASKVLQIPELQNICERLINMLPVPFNGCTSQELQNHVSMTAINCNVHCVSGKISGLKQVRDFFWSLICLRYVCDHLLKTCRRCGRKPGFKQVLSQIDVMECGQNTFRQIKKSRTWSRTWGALQ